MVKTLSDEFQTEARPLIVAAKVDNSLRELTATIVEDVELEFVDLSNQDGIRIYQRSLLLVLLRAAIECFSDIHLTVEHSLNKGLYIEVHYSRALTDEDVFEIRQRMSSIIDSGELFMKKSVTKEEAAAIFEDLRMGSKKRLLDYRSSDYINVYSLGWMTNYFYGYMVPSTRYLSLFDLKRYADGLILLHPDKFTQTTLPEYVEQEKLAQIYRESEAWARILDVSYVYNLNDMIVAGRYSELIRIAEALHEKKIAQIADQILQSGKRVILIAGPSSSGKTTFAHRLMIQLRVNGLRPVTLGTDDYFVDRAHTPLDESGDYDFEALEAVDTEKFNDDVRRLLAGEEVDLPNFNFLTGEREYNGRKLKIDEDQPLVIEGIHGLNEKMTEMLDKKTKFKIYISALTQLNIDEHNRIPTTDSRLIRRIIRDHRTRGHSAEATIQRWPSVRRGEERNIFPFQEEADIMFNSSMVYELAILKKYAEPLLKSIDEKSSERIEAKRLLKFLSYFVSIESDLDVPSTSILKEFIGGSCF
ncbi:MAG: nucleoside kinase [Acidaminobacter sp.]|nr:nucleoside kinase [Acidaminobacter sp.]